MPAPTWKFTEAVPDRSHAYYTARVQGLEINVWCLKTSYDWVIWKDGRENVARGSSVFSAQHAQQDALRWLLRQAQTNTKNAEALLEQRQREQRELEEALS